MFNLKGEAHRKNCKQLMAKMYMVVAHVSYKGRETVDYICEKGLTKREANRYLSERCYTTPSRTYTIENQSLYDKAHLNR